MGDGFLSALVAMVEEAVHSEPPPELRAFCAERYRPYYYLMYQLAASMGVLLPQGIIVELGVERGRGCAALSLGAPEYRVFGVDHTRRAAITPLQQRFPNFVFLEQSSTPVPDTVRNQRHLNYRLPISILHIDTDHTYGQARSEFLAYEPHLHDKAVVLFDDTHAEADDVARFVAGLKHPMIFDERLHECGYAVVAYTRSEP